LILSWDSGSLSLGLKFSVYDATPIYTKEQLAAINSNSTTLSKNYILMNDITLSGYWTPIGSYNPSKPFTGTFDGAGHVISGLSINDPSAIYQGLFGYLGSTGTVKNLGVIGNVTASRCGGVVGYNSGTIENCYFSGNVTGEQDIGGIAGDNNTTSSIIRNCYATGSVTGTGTYYTGGIVGDNYGGTVEYCYATNSVSGNQRVGGIAGRNFASSSGGPARIVENCVALNPSITGNSTSVAGCVIGVNDTATMSNNYARMDMLVNGSGVSSGSTTDKNGAFVAVDGSNSLSNVFSGWSTEIWDIPSINLAVGGALPTLKGFASGVQTPTLPASASSTTYTVTFNSNGGSSVSSISNLTSGSKITAPTAPTSTGYNCIFGGWYKDTSLTNAWNFTSDTVTSNITLYAKWSPYAIGDTGPGGGKIFYRSQAGFTMTDNGERCYYLEAAPTDILDAYGANHARFSIYSDFSMFYKDIGTGIEIGTGRKNTNIILAEDSAAPAALACKYLNTGGKTDWFLPSKLELYELYQNKTLFGNLTTENTEGFEGYGVATGYWSSSQQSNDTYFYYCAFYDGTEGPTSGSGSYLVRAIRAF